MAKQNKGTGREATAYVQAVANVVRGVAVALMEVQMRWLIILSIALALVMVLSVTIANMMLEAKYSGDRVNLNRSDTNTILAMPSDLDVTGMARATATPEWAELRPEFGKGE